MRLKKCFSLLVAVLMVTMMSSIFAADANVGPYVVTNNDDFASTLTGTAIDSFEIKDGALLVTMASAGTPDPNFNIPLDMLSSEVDCSVYKALAINVKLSKGGDSAFVYFDTDANPGLGEDKNLSAKYADSTDWQTVVWDFSKHAKFNGTLTTLRLDPFSTCKDVTYQIKWIAFFKTVEEAAAFNGVFPNAATQAPAASSTAGASATASTAASSTAAASKSPAAVSASKQPSAATSKPDSDDETNNTWLIISIAAGAVVVIGIVVFVVIKKKKQ